MAEHMFGLETEYALSALGPGGKRVDQGRAIAGFMDLAHKTLPHLPGRSSGGVFLQNGSRFYIDSGAHPELCTPELVNPWDACRYVLAGDRILAELAEETARRDHTIDRVILTRCNVCYGPFRPTTWGCHECYGHRADPSALPDELISHLVSRVIYTGAGGFNNRSAGIEFMVSPRVAHLVRVVSDASTHSRGIYHNKNESLSRRGFNRLHVLCGESVCSQTSLWLKMAVTSLVVAMIEARLSPCRKIRLHDPLAAMKSFAADVGCTVRVRSANRRHFTAIEMQRHILEQLEVHADHPVMPPWAPQARTRLRQVLDRLEQGPAAVAKTLDWAVKLSLYREFARRRGICWESLPDWSHVLVELDQVLRQKAGRERPGPLSVELLRGRGPVAGHVSRLTPWLKKRGLSWDQFEGILTLRQELFELDTRFAQLGEQGLFTALDQAGALEHAVEGVDSIEHAMVNPPDTGRGRLRGQCVKRFHNRAGGYYCDWMGVWDDPQRRYLDLSEPFATEENWKEMPRNQRSQRTRFPGSVREILSHGRSLYDRGRYEDTHRLLRSFYPYCTDLSPEHRLEFFRLQAWVASRRGFLDGLAMLDELRRGYGTPLWLITDYVSTYRFRGLVPSPEISAWIRKGEELLGEHPDAQPEMVAAFREHRGYFLLAEGRLEEARQVLEEVCGPRREALQNARIFCRAAAALGEVYRRLGDRRKALHLVERAAAEQTVHHYRGDLADFSLSYQAKLQPDPDTARRTLAQAGRIQAESHNRMGETRTLLLQARLSEPGDRALPIKNRVVELRVQLPALGQCRLMASVLESWDEWAGGERKPDESGDVFWGV